MRSIEDALILAATKGARMGPVATYLPKCLLPVGDLPIIAHHLHDLEACGVRRAHICLEESLGPMVEHSLCNGYQGSMELRFDYDPDLKGIGYSTWRNRDHISGDFIVTLADEVVTSKDFFQKLGTNKSDFVIGVTRYEDEESIIAGCNVELDQTDRIVTRLIEKPDSDEIMSHWCWTGFASFSNDIFGVLDELIRESFTGELDLTLPLQRCIERNYSVGYVKESGTNINITNLADYHRALAVTGALHPVT